MEKKKKSTPVRECTITDEDIHLCGDIVRYLKQRPYEKLLEIGSRVYDTYFEEWVDGIPHKPDDWESKSKFCKKFYYYSIHEVIDERIGIKGVWRYKRSDLTNKQFDDWWDSVTDKQLNRLGEKLDNRNRYTDKGEDRGDYKTQYKQYFIGTVSLILSSLSLGIAITSLLL